MSYIFHKQLLAMVHFMVDPGGGMEGAPTPGEDAQTYWSGTVNSVIRRQGFASN